MCAGFVGLDQAQKRLTDGLRQHVELGAALLLLQNDHRLVEIRIALRDLLPQYADLGILATQAEDGRSSHVGMVDVSRNQAAQIVGIFPGPAAPAFMQQELDAVNILENPTRDR